MNKINRRHFLGSYSISLFGVGLIKYSEKQNLFIKNNSSESNLSRYPAINDELTFQIVNASHFDYEKVKTLVSKRPELAVAFWDWGYGDFESALGAASHTGRRDIAELLISYGARPDLFTYAMMGMLKSVKEIITTFPGIQSRRGPHGITLWKHVQTRMNNNDISLKDKKNVKKVADYLEKIGNSNIGADNLELSENDKIIFLGNYKFGEGDTEMFIVGTSSLGPYINITRKGLPGRLLLKVKDNTFSPTGAPSVKVVFEVKNNQTISLSIYEPELMLTAFKQ